MQALDIGINCSYIYSRFLFTYKLMETENYYSAWGEVLLFIIGALIFLTITLLVSKIIRPSRPNSEKGTTYETGEETIGTPWIQFNFRFYIIALLFLIFEVEIIFLFPWAVVLSRKELMEATGGWWGWYAWVEGFVFIFILALGLAYAWRNAMLDWVKPEPKPTPFESKIPEKWYEALNEKYKSSAS